MKYQRKHAFKQGSAAQMRYNVKHSRWGHLLEELKTLRPGHPVTIPWLPVIAATNLRSMLSQSKRTYLWHWRVSTKGGIITVTKGEKW